MRTLPEKQRTVMVLRYYGDLSEAEIADTMGISRGSVKSHAARATKSLRQRPGAEPMNEQSEFIVDHRTTCASAAPGAKRGRG